MKHVFHRTVFRHLQTRLHLYGAAGNGIFQNSSVRTNHALAVSHGTDQRKAGQIEIVAHVTHHGVYRARRRQFKGPVYTVEMGIEMHTAQCSHGTVMVKNEAIVFDARDQLRLAAAHVAEYHRSRQTIDHRFIKPFQKRGLKRYSCAQERIANQPC